MQDCATCRQDMAIEPVPRWKAPLLFVGVLLFCPCHLPATFGVVAALGAGLGGAAWFFGQPALVYVAFSLVYLVLVAWLLRWFLASRDRERRLEEFHAGHADAS